VVCIVYTKYIPQLPEHEQSVVTMSWERLRTVLENLPRKRIKLPKMKLMELPKQVKSQRNNLPAYLEQFQTTETRELVGATHVVKLTGAEAEMQSVTDKLVSILSGEKPIYLNCPSAD